MSTDTALTCESCRAEPATHLTVLEVGAPGCKAPIIVKRLVGDVCVRRNGDDASKVAVTAPSAWLFTLTPALEVASA